MRHLAGLNYPVMKVLAVRILSGIGGREMLITGVLAGLGYQLSLTAHNRTLGRPGRATFSCPKRLTHTGFENRPSGGRSHMERMGLGFRLGVQRMQHKRGGSPGTSRVAIRRLSMYLCAGPKRLTICHINHEWQVMLQKNSGKRPLPSGRWLAGRDWVQSVPLLCTLLRDMLSILPS